ncbi:MAG: glycosyltransferase [Deltaproteobacteria bacterium]|nr:glycosyltransferase [Deltaproteobacteria bacterium]
MTASWLKDNLKRNLEALTVTRPDLASLLASLPYDLANDKVTIPLEKGAVLLELSPKGLPALALDLGSGPKRLTSAVNPQKEDATLAQKFFESYDPKVKGVTVLGLGLGYLLEALVSSLPLDAELALVEPRLELVLAAFLARDLSLVIKRPKLTWFIGQSFKVLPSSAPVTLLARPANLRLDQNLYPASLNPKAPKNKPPKVLFLDAGYYLGREIPRAITQLKGEVKPWPFDPLNTQGQEYRSLLMEIKEFRPDLVLTVNHLGLDTDGLLLSVLRRLGLPLASWFVDSPLYILEPGPQGDIFVFSWDRDYIEPLKALGLTKVELLPLASDLHYFAPGSSHIARDLAFVGDSLAKATEKYLKLTGLDPGFLPTIDQMAAKFLLTPDLTPKTESLAPETSAPETLALAKESLNPAQKRALGALITWRASRLSRVAVLKALSSFNLTVRGDEGWLKLLPQTVCGPSLDYYQDLAAFYRSTAINLNVTSAQMKTGLNQRVFDAPLAGGFLLTDERTQIHDLFAADEAVTYADPMEAKEFASFYLKNPHERFKVIAKAQKRIEGEHLYVHRLKKIFNNVLGYAP